MLIDATLTKSFAESGAHARQLEDAGYDGVWTGETKHDPFLAMLAGRAGDRARHDRHGGRDRVRPYADDHRLLGVRPRPASAGVDSSSASAHRSSRTSSDGSRCRGRNRPRGCASTSWRSRRSGRHGRNGSRLDFAGDFYTHTLMTPFFAPEPHPFGPPPVFLAGVGATHDRGRRRGVRRVLLPPLHDRALHGGGHAPRAASAGARSAGLDDLDGFALAGPAFTCVGRDDERAGGGDRRDEAADRVLRLDADVPAGPRPARLG